MRNSRLLSYEIIVQMQFHRIIRRYFLFREGIDAVLSHFAVHIRYRAYIGGFFNPDMEDYIKSKLIESLFKFRFDIEEY